MFLVGSCGAFQSCFKQHYGPALEKPVSAVSPLSLVYFSIKGRRQANREMILFHSDNNAENESVQFGSLDSRNDVDVFEGSVDNSMDALPDDVREELYSNQPSELSVLKNV